MGEPRGKLVIVTSEAPAALPLGEWDDEALVTLPGAAGRAAFEVLIGRYLPRLTRYCGKFVGSPRTGEELAQETLLEAWASRERYRTRGPGKFHVFLFTLARNRCFNELRGQARRKRWNVGPVDVALPEAAPAAAPDQLEQLLEAEQRRRVREALLSLPPKLREAVLLRFDQGLEYAEIARIAGRPEATVRSRVFLGIKQLRAAVAGGAER